MEDRTLVTSDVAALLAATSLAENELVPFCAVAAAVLHGQHALAHRRAMRLWRGGRRQRLWAPEVLRLVLYAGPWAPSRGTVPTPADVRLVEDAIGLAENDAAHRAWRRELARSSVQVRERGFRWWVIGQLPLIARAIR